MKGLTVGIVLATAGILLTPVSHADDACAAFKWDVAKERTLFAGTSQPVTASRDTSAPPPLVPERLYSLALAPQAQVQVAVPLGRKASVAGAFAGLVRLKVPAPGPYRVSLDQPGWVDVVVKRSALAASDFSGAAGCSAPHKIVQFELPAGELLLQFSGVATPLIKLAVTPAGDR
jgi:hypothetical protein